VRGYAIPASDQAILIAALGMLAAHVGYGEAGFLKQAEQVPMITVQDQAVVGGSSPTPMPSTFERLPIF
jgi:hypothetical protein